MPAARDDRWLALAVLCAACSPTDRAPRVAAPEFARYQIVQLRADWIVRLDTNHVLAEAIALYRSAGYEQVPAFNDERHADQYPLLQVTRDHPQRSATPIRDGRGMRRRLALPMPCNTPTRCHSAGRWSSCSSSACAVCGELRPERLHSDTRR